MKKKQYSISTIFRLTGCILAFFGCSTSGLMAQGSATDTTSQKTTLKPVKNTFTGNWLMDNPSVMVPQKGTFEFILGHRFGTFENGYSDCYGLFNPGNVRMGFNYAPINNLYAGFGFSAINLVWDGNLKIAIVKQSKEGGWPVSVTYYGDMAIDTRSKSAADFYDFSDRLSYYHSIIIARKINDKISIQGNFSLSYFNNVAGKYDTGSSGEITSQMQNTNFSFALMGRYKLTPGLGIIVDYDQPLTQNYTNNPHPNFGFGLDVGTAGHNFQVFFGNFQNIVPQYDNTFNQNNFHDIGQWCIGFNISRKWNF